MLEGDKGYGGNWSRDEQKKCRSRVRVNFKQDN